jgi:CHAT domain-containing protein/Tfp pilus assembly protein PilF
MIASAVFLWLVGAAAESAVSPRPVPAAAEEVELAGGESHAYQVEVEAGRPLLIDVEQQGIDVVVAATAPGGRPLPAVDNPNGRRGPEILVLRPDPPGVYAVEVRAPSRFVPAGRYRIHREALTEPSLLAAYSLLAEAAQSYHLGTGEGRRSAAGKLEEALAAWKTLGRVPEEAESLAFLAAVHRALGEPRAALDLFRQAAERRLSLGDAAGRADALVGAGLASWELGDTAAALAAFDAALPLYQAAGDRSSEAAARNNVCLVHLAAGALRTALPCFEQAVAAFAALGDRGREATARNNLGGVYDGLGEPLAARESYARALAFFRVAGDVRGESQALNNVAGIDSSLGEPEQALAAYREALALFQKTGDRLREGKALNNLGCLYLGLGNPERARSYLEQALDLNRKVGDRRGEAATLNNLGVVLARLGDPPRSLALHGEALKIAVALGDPATESAALELMSEVQLAQGDRRAALASLEQALPVARAMGDRGREGLILERRGRTLAAAGETAAALESLSQALVLHRAVLDPVGQIETLHEIATLEHRQGSDGSAWARIDEALGLLESFRDRVPDPTLRSTFLAARQGVFELAVELRMSGGFVRQALEMSERARARSLIDLLGEAGAQVRQGVDPALQRQEREVLQRFGSKALHETRLLSGAHSAEDEARARQELEGLRAEADRIEAEIRRKSPRYAALQRPAPLDAAAVQALLDADTLLLEISLGEARSFLWRVSATEVTAVELPGRAVLEAQAEEVCRRLRQPGARDGDPAAAELARLVLGPLAGTLGNHRLVLVADGALQLVPWAALPDPDAPSDPLLIRHEILSLPSASVLAVQRCELAERPPAPQALAVLADPVFDRRDSRVPLSAEPADSERGAAAGDPPFSRLPATRREAMAIASLVPAGQLLQALDFQASRETAEAPEIARFRIVHFATHGVLDTSAPELSGLVLSLVGADGRPRDGFLGLGDIYNLRLGADLVVLSGCETALGQQVRGEGLVGLTQGFFYAGARRVVASLWRVEDRSTEALMVRFYRGLLVEGLPPAAALRKAQLEIRRTPRWQEPYHWAPFILEGDWLPALPAVPALPAIVVPPTAGKR